MALSLPFHHAEEQRWLQQDRFGEITGDSLAMSQYEHLVTQLLQSELLDKLGKLPEPRQ